MTEKIAGRCPMGCGETLFLGEGGYVTCSLLGCPNPCAVANLLADPLSHEHVVTFGTTGFDVQHPLAERGQDLVQCGLHQHIRLLNGPPVQPGRYIARHSDEAGWTWTTIAAHAEQVTEQASEALGDLNAAAEAFWGWLRDHLSVWACKAVENEGIHPKTWQAAAECAIRAARGERDHRPFTTYPELER